jgi:hypothetical protein
MRLKILVPKLVPDSSELSRTPWTQSALSDQIRPARRLPAELLIRRSLVRIQPGAFGLEVIDRGRGWVYPARRSWANALRQFFLRSAFTLAVNL